MTRFLKRLARMGPDEIRTRAQQALSKRWSKPPVCRLQPLSGPAPVFLDPPSPPANLMAQAECICSHHFDLLGYEGLDFGSPIDWHFDPVHQKRAPRKPWYQISFMDFGTVGDHKIIWELNRHQHLVTLAQAWRCTKDERLAAEIRAQWQHWEQENVYPIGINWASSLEVAFRAISWLWVCQLMGDFPDDRLRALHLHGWHIERYLSTYFSPNTHLLGEGAALFAIGVLCPQIAEARRWRERGWQIVLRQAETQVRPDGMHFEQSVYYHVYALDFFEQAQALASRNGIVVPAAFDATIEKMRGALAAISQAGIPPRFGDDDGGQVVGAPSRSIAVQAGRSITLRASGIYAMTSGRSQLFIDAGPLGALAGGHGHADALSIQLIIGGRPVLLDPGTFCYTCPERYRFRGTAAHNTLQVDGRDQAEPAGPFAWREMPETFVDCWESGEAFDLFVGHHNGYASVMHQRWVFGLKSKFWLVRDVVTGSGRHLLDIHWHFLDERDLAILPPAGHNWSDSTERWDWSPIYGRRERAFVRRFSSQIDLPAEFAVLLAPGESAGGFTQLDADAYRYEDAQGAHEFRFGGDARFVYRVKNADGSSWEYSL
jgi:hypothetical protein